MAEPAYSVSVLTVSPFESDLVILSNVISHSAWTYRSARSLKEAREALAHEDTHVVLCEASLPDGDWKALLDFTTQLETAPEMIVLSRRADERLWATVLNLGGWDLLTPPFQSKEVFRSIHHAYRHWHDKMRQNRQTSTGKESPADAASCDSKAVTAGV
jgi:DNA-binding NtrC family response regulator